ncbi:MAG: cyclic nucleotide-binding domain-containing protein [Lachnospiraceae bacterium]|nr:cyclic nucleotide-binding domain-containing protein [Lachnospiraceae bacterium]
MKKKINQNYIAAFFGLNDSEEGVRELHEIESRLEKVVFENNQDICTINSEADGMYFIESGTAVVLDENNRQINVLHVGQYFGEYAVLSGQKRLSTVRSHGKTVLYKMAGPDLLDFLYKHPDIYGELMKRVYAQLSGKHSQIVSLSGAKRGVLSHPSNSGPLSKKQMLVQYGMILIVYLAALFLPQGNGAFPLVLIPPLFMLVYVLITKRTLESLVVSGILAAILVYRTGVFTGYADSVMDTMCQKDNVYTVLVMALMGGMINLIVAAGGVTAFEKSFASWCKDEKRIFLTSLFIMIVTGIDDCLNMMTASYTVYTPAKEKGVIREKQALFFSMLPTVLCSFIPLSLWGIFVTGTLFATVKEQAVSLFVRSIIFNFYSITVLVAMILFACGKLPAVRQLKEAQERYDKTSVLYPKGSEKYLSAHDTEVWGRISDVILPIIVLAISSLTFRSITGKGFITDSAVGLLATLAFMFLLYGFRNTMTPERFMQHLVDGICETVIPILLYLLTINFASLLDALGLHVYLAEVITTFRAAAMLLPFVTFVLSMFLTIALGSSWSMYAIIFPIVIGLASHLSINPALMIGAVAGAGIAGEKNCAFTSDALNVGTATGINPEAVRSLRIRYSVAFTSIAALAYLIAGAAGHFVR